ncbi:NADH-quinone oxidoreductase subunit C [Streptomyces gardneri]|uniref:NADH-quinone oxidoreductase subunit C n=1 Tax=Streptomyces gardneri TaxID=66892 RepID=UPI0035DADE30
MSAFDSLPDSVTEIFGEEATAEHAYDLLTVDVPPAAWITALTTARDELGCTYFDWLSAVDEPGTGFRVCAHVVALSAGHPPRRLLLRTTVPHAAPVLPTAIGVYAGAGWHERETHEMFGVDFTGHPHLVPLLLPENFEGHPLRKDFVLAARVAKAWPGAKEPGESHDGGGPKRRQMLPPGVPDPNEWGPLKGQLPPAPTRPTRAAAGRARATTEGSEPGAPVRRSRSVTEGSASQPDPATPARRSRTTAEGSASQPTPDPSAPVRRSRTASEGSASQATPEEPATSPETPATPRRSRTTSDGSASQATPEPGSPVRRSRTASEGSASQTAPEEPGTSPEPPAAPTARPPRRSRTTADGSASQTAPDAATPATPRTRSSDAPWHHARPAFDEKPEQPEPPAQATPAKAAEGSSPAAAEPEGGGAASESGGPPAGRGDAAETTETTDPAGGDPA